MPDTRRIAGPENTQSPFAFVTRETTEVVKDGKRADGRSVSDHRPIYLNAGVLNQAKGSAFAEFGQTKVMCAVYGPRAVPRREDFSIQGQITCDVKFAPFSCRVRRQHLQDAQEKDFSAQLLEAIEPAVRLDTFPKCQVDIYVSVLENDGSVLSAAITGACLALTDAGIELYDLFVSCTARILGQTVLIDPTDKEENAKTAPGQNPGGEVTVAFMPSLRQVSTVGFRGETGLEMLTEVTQKCQDTCQKLYQVLQQTVVSNVLSHAKIA